MALEIMTIASSSKGNCILVRNKNAVLLVDMGISLRRLSLGLKEQGLSLNDVDGVLITHEHIDHIRGLKSLCCSTNIPVYAHNDIIYELENRINYTGINHYGIIESGFAINGIDVQPFRVQHDTICPLGFSFMDNNSKVSIATDLGVLTDGVIRNLCGSNIVLLESNHDETMVANSSYPALVIERILSNKGHLSILACAKVLPVLVESGLETIILGHLSDNNNNPRLAYSTSADSLIGAGMKLGEDVILDVALGSVLGMLHTA